MSKTIALSLVLAASLGLAACGSKEEAATNNVANNTMNAAENTMMNAANTMENAANTMSNAANNTANAM
ncbi:MAG: circumsporozoite protein [Sphingobium sp.]|nr:circumsporozoite protein [Sphingobium sp.]